MYKFLFVAFITLSVFYVISLLYKPLGDFLEVHESVILGIMIFTLVIQEIYLHYYVGEKNATPQ